MSQTSPPAEEPAHDILAAEAFAVPGPDPSLRHGPVVLPEDPSGIAEPHDILAAEEFAMPVGRPARTPRGALGRGSGPKVSLGAIAAAGLAALAASRLRRRR